MVRIPPHLYKERLEILGSLLSRPGAAKSGTRAVECILHTKRDVPYTQADVSPRRPLAYPCYSNYAVAVKSLRPDQNNRDRESRDNKGFHIEGVDRAIRYFEAQQAHGSNSL